MIKKLLSLAALFSISMVALTAPAIAAKPTAPTRSQTYGIDISYPQCGARVPTDQAYGIVGVNGGNAATANTCLGTQLTWATHSSGVVVSQPKVQVYVNTGNPGQVQDQMSTKWPTSHAATVANPYGDTCTGANDQACSWEYGWGRASYSADYFTSKATDAGIPATVSSYKWWLDVEIGNSWQTGSTSALANNTAALEGWTAYFGNQQASVGLYSTATQWNQIVGSTVSGESNLNGLQNWRPGGANLSTAKQACTAAPLTAGGKVVLTQYVSKNIDYNNSCI